MSELAMITGALTRFSRTLKETLSKDSNETMQRADERACQLCRHPAIHLTSQTDKTWAVEDSSLNQVAELPYVEKALSKI